MTSYIESKNNNKEYVAILNASKCRTYQGFRTEMVKAFDLPDTSADNTNDISGYIFSSWLGFKRIKVVFLNSGSLKKDKKHFDGIMTLMNEWKAYWESQDNQNSFNIEVN